jgi:hypothetical protein
LKASAKRARLNASISRRDLNASQTVNGSIKAPRQLRLVINVTKPLARERHKRSCRRHRRRTKSRERTNTNTAQTFHRLPSIAHRLLGIAQRTL